MTTTSPVTPARGPADPAAGRPAGFAGLMRAEWTKIRSVRSTVSYLPEQAGTLIAHTHEQSGDLLSLARVRGPVHLDGASAGGGRLPARAPRRLTSLFMPRWVRP